MMTPSLSHSPIPDFDGVHLTLPELLYYQTQIVRWLPPAKSLWATAGQHQSRQLGRGMDFAEVRQYQAGDDIRAMDWRVTARTGKPHTKLFSEEREKPVMLLIDLSPSMQFGSTLMLKSVLAAHMASLVSWLAVAQHDRIGAVIDTGETVVELKPTRRKQGALAIMQTLITLHQQGLHGASASSLSFASHSASSFEASLNALHRLGTKGGDAIIISDFVRFTDDHAALLTPISRHHRLRLVQIVDPLEQGKTTYRGNAYVSDRTRSQWLNFGSRRIRAQIQHAFDTQQARLHTFARSLGIGVTCLSSDQFLLPQLSR